MMKTMTDYRPMIFSETPYHPMKRVLDLSPKEPRAMHFPLALSPGFWFHASMWFLIPHDFRAAAAAFYAAKLKHLNLPLQQ
jgi:hypothetical protein